MSAAAEAGGPDFELELGFDLLHLVIVGVISHGSGVVAAHHIAILVFIVVVLVLHEELALPQASALITVAIVVLLHDVVMSKVAGPCHRDILLVFVSLMVVLSWL